MSRRRKLRPEEEALWDKVAETTERMHAPKPSFLAETETKRPKPKTPEINRPPEPIHPFKIGQKSKGKSSVNDLLPSISDRVGSAPVQMDRKAFSKMKRGKLVPEGRIDLHGMTLAQAHPALSSFIIQSQMRGFRLVLVITGKGKSRDDGDHQNQPLALRIRPHHKAGQRRVGLIQGHAMQINARFRIKPPALKALERFLVHPHWLFGQPLR